MRRHPPKKSRYLRWILWLAAILLITTLIVLAVNWLMPQLSKLSFLPNSKVEEFHQYFALDAETVSIILEDKRVTSAASPWMENGEVALAASFVQEYMDPFLFWDAYAHILYVTTRTEVMRFSPGALTYTLNDERLRLDTPVRQSGEEVYLPIGLVSELYPFDITYQPKYNMVIIDPRYEGAVRGTAELQKKADIRYRPELSSVIALKVEKDETLTLYEEDGDFTRIRTADGLLGYVETSALSALVPAVWDKPKESENKVSLWPVGKKINMMWEAVYHQDANTIHTQTPLPDGLNVIVPTWFSFNAESFALQSLGSREYVEWAHAQGCQVWGMLPDDTNVISHAILTDASARKRVIEELMAYASEYGLDGLNIDFEHVRAEDGPYYIAFLRELAPAARRNNLILSVDVYVPASGTPYYKRDLVAQTVDFVCVMTYDEHVRSSDTSGPVASLPFVQQGVTDMLLEVPKEQLLMGMPFYNRIWREVVNNDNAETRQVQHFGMARTQTYLADNGVEMAWDAEIGSYYGDYAVVEDGETVLYRIWQEDEHSIAEKLKIFQQENLAGIAGWHRGFENEAVWALLKEACKS